MKERVQSGSVALVVSRDVTLQCTRALLLRSIGYETVCVFSLEMALRVAMPAMAAIIVVDHGFSSSEHGAFTHELGQRGSSIPILLLEEGFISPETLLAKCDAKIRTSHSSGDYDASLSQPRES